MTENTFPVNHVAIIMDGNGRWATSRLHKRIWGHIRGTNTISKIVQESQNLGIGALTLYAFSTENWSRPLLEVQTLFKLLKKYIMRERKRIIQEKIRFKVIGDISNLPNETKNLVISLEKETQNNEGLILSFAFGYGGRAEIVAAVNRLLKEKKEVEVSETTFSKYLMNPESGDVDLLIRTGGDRRISNFLLWQVAYAELFFTDTMWPDFSSDEFREICQKVASRERRFGSTDTTISLQKSKEIAENNKQIIKETLR